MNIVLTGASGFIGSCFLWKLNQMGFDDITIVDTAPNPDHPNLKGKTFQAYFTREELLERVNNRTLRTPGLIVHLGACADTTERNVAFLERNNIAYSRALADYALEVGAEYHYASSAAIYGDGKMGYSDEPADFPKYKALNPYGESKRLFDQWVYDQKLDARFVGYRYFNVFGPNEYHKGDMQSMVSKAFKQIGETGKVRLFASSRVGYADGSEERDFIYVKDVVDAMAFFVANKGTYGIFNLGTGQARTFRDLVSAVFVAMGKEPAFDFIPMPEKLKGQYQYFTQATISRLRKAGFDRPFRTLEEAVRDYVQAHLAKTDPYL